VEGKGSAFIFLIPMPKNEAIAPQPTNEAELDDDAITQGLRIKIHGRAGHSFS